MPKTPEAEKNLNIETRPLKPAEITPTAAIKSLMKHKVPGIDCLNAQMFKANVVTMVSILKPLHDTRWNRKKIPDDWNQGIIMRILKKGTLSECSH